MQFSWPIFFIVLMLGVVQLAVGVVFGRCLPILQPKSAKTNRFDARRLREFANRMCRLVNSVAEDVDQHRSQIRQASEDLSLAENVEGGDLTEFVLKSVAQIMQINERLQSRLSTTEDTLQQQAEQIESHMTEARTDSLTGLPNRRAFDDELARRLAEWQRKKATFCLLMIDIDHFKTFNDQYGHPAGDYVLRSVGEVFQKVLRDMDLVCRIGGEEFAVLFPSTSPFDARRATERIRKAVAAEGFQFEQNRLQLTISLGLAAVEHDDDTVSLVQRADEALYMAKAEGRNCGCFHNSAYCELIDSAGRPTNRDRSHEAAEATELATICDGLRTRLTEVAEEATNSQPDVDERR